jgi:hypothetical protein
LDYASVGVPLPFLFRFSFFAGWVEQSETHHCERKAPLMGFASLNPPYKAQRPGDPAGRFSARFDRRSDRKQRRDGRPRRFRVSPCGMARARVRRED